MIPSSDVSTGSTKHLSVVVMTYNEEANIDRCLDSVKGLGDEIFILDSYSTDRTVEIARAHGARVEQHVFENYADQRRRLYAMAGHDWILTLDADEYLSPELQSSVRAALAGHMVDVYTSNRRSSIGNTWLHHGSWYPDRKIRMFDRTKASVVGIDVHEAIQALPGARISHLRGDLMHRTDEDIQARYQKVNLYSTRAAKGLYQQGKCGNIFRILIKPWARFINVYFLRLGFLDGFYGYVVARSEAHYVYLREMKLLEEGRSKEQGAKSKEQRTKGL